MKKLSFQALYELQLIEKRKKKKPSLLSGSLWDLSHRKRKEAKSLPKAFPGLQLKKKVEIHLKGMWLNDCLMNVINHILNLNLYREKLPSTYFRFVNPQKQEVCFLQIHYY